MNPLPAPSRLHRQRSPETLVLGLALLMLAPANLGGNLHAQTDTTQATKPQQQQKVAAEPAQLRQDAATYAHAASTRGQPARAAIVMQPSASLAPILSADQPFQQAKVSWDRRGLKIEASNSSLNQILQQVAADSGAKLEGLTQDQRVFGSYGPGPACDVLSKLLDGSGYNVLMIGSSAAGAPVEIVLSARSPASPQIPANNQNRNNSDDIKVGEQFAPKPQPDYPAGQPRPQAIQNPFSNGGSPPRDPLQFMQEILERQHQIDQQQQEQQNNPKQ